MSTEPNASQSGREYSGIRSDNLSSEDGSEFKRNRSDSNENSSESKDQSDLRNSNLESGENVPYTDNSVTKETEDGEVYLSASTSNKRVKSDEGIDISDAFSRRETHTYNKTPSSIYSEEKKEVPAWMKSKPTDKYDKYGARTAHRIMNNVNDEKDERYSKYISSSTSNRIKRTYDESKESDRYAKCSKTEEPESTAAPYTNLEIANPSNYYQTFESHITNKQNKDINSIVRTHYNQRTQQSKFQGSRTKSPIYKLRNFNNAIKYILLNNFTKKIPDKPTVLLDLCCGKGGDLNKCEFVSIDQYIGIDISDASIKEAFSRYSKNKARFIPKNYNKRDSRRYNFEACFATGDCFLKSIPEILEPNFPGIIEHSFPVDCVSIQFALHYSFETEEKVRNLLTNISKSLRPGGTFIGTIPSSDFIRDKILKNEFIADKKFGNDLYSVTFENDPPNDGIFRPPFGNKYDYYLKDAVDNVPEYVVPFETFRLLCEDFGLTLKYKKNFIEIFNEEIPKYFNKLNKNLIEGMKRSDGKYGAEGLEKEAVGFYLGFVFEKLG